MILTAENSSTERGVRQQANLLLTANLSQFAFATPVDQTEIVLNRLHPIQMVTIGGPKSLHETPGGFVAGAGQTNLTGFLEVCQSRKSFLMPHPMIRPVSLVEVDVIGLETLQAGFHLAHHLVTVQGGHAVPDRWNKPTMSGTGDFGR